VGEEEGAGEVEVEQLLPLLERELVEGGGGPGHDGAAAHRVDQDVDAPVRVDGPLHHALHRGRVERVRPQRERAGARRGGGARPPAEATSAARRSSAACATSTPTTVPPSRAMIIAVAFPMPA